MPVLAGTSSSSTGSGIVRPVDLPSASWIDPYGVVWPLTDPTIGWFTTQGVKGLGAAPVQYTTDAQERGGVALRNAYNPARAITWPLYVEGRTHAEFLGRWRALGRAFTSTQRRGPGQLVIGRPDGSQRAIDAVYQDGYDGDAELGGVLRDVAVLTLLCPKPWWRALDPTPLSRAYAGAGGNFLSPYPTVSSSQALGATTFVNPGELPVWPSWTITGPASSITAANNTRGESWTLDVVAYRGTALVAGEVIRITTDPPAVIGPDGVTSWYGALNNPSAVLWQLDEGSSDITFTVAGASTGTAIEASFYQLFETA